MTATEATLVEIDPALPLTETPARKPASRGRIIWHRLRRSRGFWIGAIVLGAIVLWALVGPLLWPIAFDLRDYSALNQPPSVQHPFGTDTLGYDIFARVMQGLRISLIVGFVAGPLATLLSALVGSIAGYVGGFTDKAIAWVIDLLLVLPSFFILVLLYPFFRNAGWIVMTFFLALFGWMIMAQVIRSQTRSLREREFVKAARYMGFGSWSVVTRHIVPNVASLLIIDAALGVGAMILSETTLSFFGFGVQAPDVSLGTLIEDGNTAAATRPWLFAFPAGTLVLILLSLSLIGDALRDAIDPTSGVNRG
ncbi:ABC transporter permease [Microbacterium ulmi]|uniref:Oligopeptide transport system permease protein OppC n=1 Tax=Microbacterium ulmi TaxID=179095 RepID=A0A7Y2Q261_9MICO|nr:ABC transporter permease [Microbacterium ulmi]NII71421.1 peptide/nickel transport system permease protein [Microbacterium ulmi]NNH04675.1 ABC transporter permease [Microbacterium ulmi]